MKKIFSIVAVLATMFTANMQAALNVGDSFLHNGRTYVVTGTNLITNPSFDNGVTGWTGGAGGAIAPVTTNTSGGVDGGAYIVPTAGGGNGSNNSIGTGWAIEPNKTYVFDHYVKYTDAAYVPKAREGYMPTSLVNAVGTAETKVMNTDTIMTGGVWTLNRLVFTNTTPYAFLQYRARWLSGGKAFDDFLLAEVTEKPDNSFLLQLISECEDMLGGKEESAFLTAIAAAKAKTDAPDAVTLNAALAELQERQLDYRIANATENYVVNVTARYVKNAEFTNLLTDWTCGNIAVKNGINPIIYSHFGASTREMELQNDGAALSNNYCQQTITKLRKGYYRFGADILAYNSGTPTDSVYGTYLMCNGALTSVSTHGTTGTVAKKFYVEGVVTDSSVVIGLKTVGTNATTIYMDNVTLEYMGFDASIYMTSLRDKIKNYIVVSGKTLLPGVLDELKKAVVASETQTTDEAELAIFYENLDKAYKQATTSLTLMADLQAQILDMNNLLIAHSDWPGFAACQTQLVAANGLLTSGASDIATSKYADLVNMIATMKQAKKDYILSQPATDAAPADLTLLVQAPSFRVVGTDNIETATRISDGWETANVTNGGDYRTSFNQSNTCYNSWSTSFTSMNLYQKITGLPAGIYTVTCSAITQPDDLNDQHAYVGSSLTTAVSPNMTTASWYDATTSPNGSGVWEQLTTKKVVLLAGDTLRIGFASTHNAAAVDAAGAARGQNGWFSVTGFQLSYYGTTGADAIVSGDVTNAEAIASTVALTADRNQVASLVATAKENLNTNAGYAKVYESLNAATQLANTSILAHKNFLAANYAKVDGMAKSDTLSTDVDAILTAAVTLANDSIAKATATYGNLTSLNTKLASYITYTYAYKAAETFVGSIGSATSDKYILGLQYNMSKQKAALSTDLTAPATIADYMTLLSQGIADAKLSLALAGGNNQDMNYLIVNQPLAATSGTVAPEGWTVTGSKDAITKTGQYMDDNTTKRYFDTYGTGGLLFSASQKIKVPNGTYTVTAIARTPAEGVFIYAQGDKKYQTEVPLRTYDKLVSNGTGLADSTGQVADTYGPIWEAAAEGSAVKLANSGKGRGWGQILVDDVVVNNHEITIGFSSDSTFTGKPFKGTWFSIVDFTLTLKTMGDNTGWVINAIKNNPVGNKEIDKVEYFLLSGVRVANLVKGFNIVKTTYTDGSTKVSKIFQQ